jgi:hypothetical protein
MQSIAVQKQARCSTSAASGYSQDTGCLLNLLPLEEVDDENGDDYQKVAKAHGCKFLQKLSM